MRESEFGQQKTNNTTMNWSKIKSIAGQILIVTAGVLLAQKATAYINKSNLLPPNNGEGA